MFLSVVQHVTLLRNRISFVSDLSIFFFFNNVALPYGKLGAYMTLKTF
jgi:hypothetical protein